MHVKVYTDHNQWNINSKEVPYVFYYVICRLIITACILCVQWIWCIILWANSDSEGVHCYLFHVSACSLQPMSKGWGKNVTMKHSTILWV